MITPLAYARINWNIDSCKHITWKYYGMLSAAQFAKNCGNWEAAMTPLSQQSQLAGIDPDFRRAAVTSCNENYVIFTQKIQTNIANNMQTNMETNMKTNMETTMQTKMKSTMKTYMEPS